LSVNFFRQKSTADLRRNTEGGKEVGGDPHARDLLGLAVIDEIIGPESRCRDVLERLGLAAQIQEACVGEVTFVVRMALADSHQTSGIRKGKRAQQNGIHDAEDHRVRADTQGERDYSDRGEPGLSYQHPDPVLQVLK